MNGYQKAIKWISIITIIFAVLSILMGMASCGLGGLALGAASVDGSSASSDVAVGGVLMFSVGGVAIIGGIIDLIVGLLGLRGAKDPNKITPFFVLVIIGLIFGVLDVVLTLMSGTGIDPTSLASAIIHLVLMVILLVCANKVRQMRMY